MTKFGTLTVLFALGAANMAAAEDFSEGSQAAEWGLNGESKARFAATVVDPLCELTGDCPDNCGDGARQLALLRSADDVMVMQLKNVQPAFTGDGPWFRRDPRILSAIAADGYLGLGPEADREFIAEESK